MRREHVIDCTFVHSRVCISSVKFEVVVFEEVLKFFRDGTYGDVLAKIVRPKIVGAKATYSTQVNVVLKIDPDDG